MGLGVRVNVSLYTLDVRPLEAKVGKRGYSSSVVIVVVRVVVRVLGSVLEVGACWALVCHVEELVCCVARTKRDVLVQCSEKIRCACQCELPPQCQ